MKSKELSINQTKMCQHCDEILKEKIKKLKFVNCFDKHYQEGDSKVNLCKTMGGDSWECETCKNTNIFFPEPETENQSQQTKSHLDEGRMDLRRSKDTPVCQNNKTADRTGQVKSIRKEVSPEMEKATVERTNPKIDLDNKYDSSVSVQNQKLIDIKDMEGFNPEVKNGIDSVSTGKVFFGKNKWMPDFAQETVCCKKHGAMLCITEVKEGKLYRCPTCNEGAINIIQNQETEEEKIDRVVKTIYPNDEFISECERITNQRFKHQEGELK